MAVRSLNLCRMLGLVLACMLPLLVGGCANDSRPVDHAEFAEKWVNAVSGADANDLNCKLALGWFGGPNAYSSCQDVYEYVQQQYLGVQESHRQEGGQSDATDLRSVSFECQLDDREGSIKDHERWGTKLPITCLDEDGMGVQVLLDRFGGSSEDYSVYQVEGVSKFWP